MLRPARLLCLAGLVSLVFAAPVLSQDREVRFSAFVADVETGHILTADRIDSPRQPDLLGRFLTVGLAAQDIANGALDPVEDLAMGRWTITAWDSAVATAHGGEGWRGAVTVLANRLGRTPSGYQDLLDATMDRAGLQATRLRVVRDGDGGPGFEGYTTSRDMGRAATAFLRAHETTLTQIFTAASEVAPMTRAWIADSGMCLLAAHAPQTRRLMVAVVTGAPTEEACLDASATLIRDDDQRLARAIAARGGPSGRPSE